MKDKSSGPSQRIPAGPLVLPPSSCETCGLPTGPNKSSTVDARCVCDSCPLCGAPFGTDGRCPRPTCAVRRSEVVS